MTFLELSLSGLFKIKLDRHIDSRGFFARYFCKSEFEKSGLVFDWAQMNVSRTAKQGTLRGMHFQYPPAEETKLISCTKGEVFDVVVDLRKGSPTFGQWHSEVLSDENRTALYVPGGFAHGFQTLTPDCDMFYCHSTAYAPSLQGGVNALDPDLKIAWPQGISDVSRADRTLPNLAELDPIQL